MARRRIELNVNSSVFMHTRLLSSLIILTVFYTLQSLVFVARYSGATSHGAEITVPEAPDKTMPNIEYGDYVKFSFFKALDSLGRLLEPNRKSQIYAKSWSLTIHAGGRRFRRFPEFQVSAPSVQVPMSTCCFFRVRRA